MLHNERIILVARNLAPRLANPDGLLHTEDLKDGFYNYFLQGVANEVDGFVHTGLLGICFHGQR